MGLSWHEVKEIIEGLGMVPQNELSLACKLYEGKCVVLLDELDAELPQGTFAYHLNVKRQLSFNKQLEKQHCALLNGLLPLSNGVVLGINHKSLRCSHESCDYSVCPVALAACFEACYQADKNADIPLYTTYYKNRRKAEEAGEAFSARWSGKLEDSKTALNLLLSIQENDFAGALVIKDDSYKDEFITDLEQMLVLMGKIDKGAVTKSHMITFLSSVDAEQMRFKFSGNELPARRLFVFDRAGEFASLDLPPDLRYPYNETARDFMIDRLAHIIDQRYVVIVGTDEELTSFCSLDARFLHTFDQHRLTIKSMPAQEVYELYASYLDEGLREKLDNNAVFKQDFYNYVSFNGDSLPFHGREMADYLAKHANACKRLELPMSRYTNSSLEEMLDSIVGLRQVKNTVRQLENYAMFKKRAQTDGYAIPSASMHMLFVGNPGTGKTMMGSIITTMLYKIGIIRQNKFHAVTAKDLTAKYVGQTDKMTHEEILKALDGVLFIDEAYALAEGGSTDGGYGGEAIAELVKSMDEYKDRLIVVLSGYEREMNDLIGVNPGLASRIGYTFRFDDYSTDELLQIYTRATARAGFTCDTEVVNGELRDLFSYNRRFKNFGNGRFVMEILHRMIVKHANRLATSHLDESHRYVLQLQDVPTQQEINDITDWEPKGADEYLEPLVGIEDIKKQIIQLESVVSYYELARRQGLKLPAINLHTICTGNPGTGKTTVARIVAQILYNVGAIPTNKFIEVEARDLAKWRSHEGQTSVEQYIKNAMGGVLFIDEAYALMYQSPGQEIVATLVKAMEDFKGDFVVIFAGYELQMREFVSMNPGLASRIGYQLRFEDYGTDELQQIFDRKIASYGLTVTPEAKELTRAIFKYFHGVEDFGNGRFVDKVVQEVIAKHATNLQKDNLALISADDIPRIKDLCKLVAVPIYAPCDVSSEEAKHRVAVHEMGHAICSLALTGETNISLVTISQEGNGALGYVEYKAVSNPLPTASNVKNRICGIMGGIAAEELLLGAYSAGGSDDLQQATNLAALYVGKYGMSDVGFLQYVSEDSSRSQGVLDVYKLPAEVREAMQRLLSDAFEKAKNTIASNRIPYDAMVEILEKEETIEGKRIHDLWLCKKGNEEAWAT